VSGIPSIEEQQELQKEEAERVRTRVEQLGKYLIHDPYVSIAPSILQLI
jgi:hypothetical protein